MSDAEQPSPVEIPVGEIPSGPTVEFSRGGRGRRSKARSPPNIFLSDLHNQVQELSARLLEYEERIRRFEYGVELLHSSVNNRVNVTNDGHPPVFHAASFDEPSHRPPRMSRRGGINGNSSHYKFNNRGGPHPGRGYTPRGGDVRA